MNSQFTKDYSSPPGPGPGAGLEGSYIDLQGQPGEIRYNPSSTSGSLTLDQHQSHSNLLNLYSSNTPVLDTSAQYTQDSGGYYQPTSHVFSTGVDTRSRLLSHTTTPSMGMAHTPRTTALPHPGTHPGTQTGTHLGSRDQYSQPSSSFRAPSSRNPGRSPLYSNTFRRHPISPSPSLSTGFATSTSRMGYPRTGACSFPPLEENGTIGTIRYQNSEREEAKIAVGGCIDKGFFKSDGEWTCYRRNYFSCVCHYTMEPYHPGVPVEYVRPSSDDDQRQGSPPAVTIQGFAMCISAVVADDRKVVELIQHTAKRDKGPTKTPSLIPLMARVNSGVHRHGNPYGVHYPDGWVVSDASGNSPQTECTFERIQFKSATLNNGKRRAAQQFYHLIIELWANIGPPGGNAEWVKVAYSKSARMIVRGRSPGHYGNEQQRRNANAGAAGSTGGIVGYSAMPGLTDFAPASIVGPYSGYHSQGPVYGGHRHHGLPLETMISPEEDSKAAIDHKSYHQYYPANMYESQPDQRVDMFNNHHPPETLPHHVNGSIDMSNSKSKDGYDSVPGSSSTNNNAGPGGSGSSSSINPPNPNPNSSINSSSSNNSNILPRLMHPPHLSSDRRRSGPFDCKPPSNGYYPHVISPSSMNLLS